MVPEESEMSYYLVNIDRGGGAYSRIAADARLSRRGVVYGTSCERRKRLRSDHMRRMDGPRSGYIVRRVVCDTRSIIPVSIRPRVQAQSGPATYRPPLFASANADPLKEHLYPSFQDRPEMKRL